MKENLSAWMDGELSGDQSARVLPLLKSNTELRGNWDCYHLIGDALRGAHGPDLCAKICARIAAEPTVLAPQRRSTADWVRRVAMPVAAGAAAVAFVGWNFLSGVRESVPQVAALPATELKAAIIPAAVGVKDYLLAHQRYSPSSAMQGVAPYVRTVAEERTDTLR